MSLDGQKSRLMMMLAVNAVCFVAAAAAIIGALAFHVAWLLPVFVACIGAGVGAQVWFILGWMKMAKDSSSEVGGRAQA
jgi:hypothetical protein